VVTAGLDTLEPPAVRLRRCDRDTGPQRALLPSTGGVRLRSGSPVPQGLFWPHVWVGTVPSAARTSIHVLLLTDADLGGPARAWTIDVGT
jgi:hypothetical protein